MKRVFYFYKIGALALLAIFFSGLAFADPPGRVARLSFVEGEVSFAPERAGKDDNWASAKTNWPITQGNRLYAATNARAEIHIGASALRISEETGVDFTRLDDDRIEAYIERGSIALTLRNWDRDDLLTIATPTSSITLNGNGRYRIDVDTDAVNVLVRQGEAQIQNGRSKFNLIASQRAEISGNDVHISRDDSEDNFDRWAAERDSRQNVAASARYVAPTTPGVYELDQYGQWHDSGEFGPVWRPNNVADDWAPYRYGRWDWISPWGWTWIDDAPWGFAPSHYGRWVYVDRYWAWHPGRFVARPVYAPALVSFIGGPGFSVSINAGQPCGWVPLAPFEAYHPYYQSSPRYLERINGNHVHRDHDYRNERDYHHNRDFPGGLTLVDPRVVLDRLPVARAILPFERNVLRDIARVSPPLPPLPGLGRLLPHMPFERHVERDRPQRDDDRSRPVERKFQPGGSPPVRDAEPRRDHPGDDGRRRADYQIPRHEVDTRVPFALEGQRPLPAPGVVRERPLGERPLPHNSKPLPHNDRPLPQNSQPPPYNDKPLPQNTRPLPAPRDDGQNNGKKGDDMRVRKIERWMTEPR